MQIEFVLSQVQCRMPKSTSAPPLAERERTDSELSLLDDQQLYADTCRVCTEVKKEHRMLTQMADDGGQTSELQAMWGVHAANVRAATIAAMFSDAAPVRTGDCRSVKLHSEESYSASRCAVCDEPACKGNALVLWNDGNGFTESYPHWCVDGMAVCECLRFGIYVCVFITAPTHHSQPLPGKIRDTKGRSGRP